MKGANAKQKGEWRKCPRCKEFVFLTPGSAIVCSSCGYSAYSTAEPDLTILAKFDIIPGDPLRGYIIRTIVVSTVIVIVQSALIIYNVNPIIQVVFAYIGGFIVSEKLGTIRKLFRIRERGQHPPETCIVI